MSVLSYRRSVWIHQWDQLGEQTIADVCDTAWSLAGADALLKKLFDGAQLMDGSIDRSPLAAASLAAFEQQQEEVGRHGMVMWPWVNATHHDQAVLHATAGPTLIVDLEPYAGFWGDTSPGDVVTYLKGLRAGGVQNLLVSIDPRTVQTSVIALGQWADLVDAVVPQYYFTDFQQPESVIVPMLDQVSGFGVEQVPALPYNASRLDLFAAWGACLAFGSTGVTLWRMGAANAQQLRDFGELALPHVALDVAELKRQLGVAQDKLTAIGHVLSA